MDNLLCEKRFGEVIIEWSSLPQCSGFEFKVLLVQGLRPLWRSYVDASQPVQNFRLIADPGVSEAIVGSFTFVSIDELLLTLQCAPNINVVNEVLRGDDCPCKPCEDEPCCPQEPFELDCDNNDANTPDPVENSQSTIVPLDGAMVYPVSSNADEQTDLFPYLYMRPWPQISAEQLAQRFVQYDDLVTPSGAVNLFEQLVTIKATDGDDARCQMLSVSVDYIDSDEFVADIDQLAKTMANFPCLFDWLKSQCTLNLAVFIEGINTMLGLDAIELYRYINSEDYSNELFLVWQSYFALVNTAGYQGELLDQLSKVLITAQLIEQMATLYDDEQATGVSEPLAQQIQAILNQGIDAVILLDSALYALPPQGMATSPEYGQDGWITPYAIGDLKIVRQKLKGYQLGEVAHIENVMPGETKQTTQRKFDVQQSDLSEQIDSQQTNEQSSSSLSSDLLNEIQKTIESESVSTTFNNLSTTYGTSSPPTATVNGSWVVAQDPQVMATGISNLAKDITNKTANRIAQNMAQVRQQSRLNGTEEVQVHGFDNTASVDAKVGIYRWVNKKYTARTVNYGNRLMIEFMVTRPAASYIQSVLDLTGIKLTPPPSLPSLGINSYRDIHRANYAVLLTTYKVESSEQYQPPSAYKVATGSLGSDDGLTSKSIAIASDYQARKASLTYVLSGENQVLMGLVGANVFTVPETLNPGQAEASGLLSDENMSGWCCTPTLVVSGQMESGTQCFLMNGETECVSVAVKASQEISSPPEPDNYCVNIEVYAVLSEAVYEQWQINVYTALVNAYDLASAAYIEKTKGPFSSLECDNALANRLLERTELKQAGLRQLLNQGQALVGESCDISSPPDPQIVNAPRYEQFLNHMFEWGEMTYHFYPDLHQGEALSSSYINLRSGTDPLFVSFLQAARARLLVPVKPQHAPMILYFLSTGMIWSASPERVPALEGNKAIVNDLITLQEDDSQCSGISEPWNITIPTSMLMVQSGDQLPEFEPLISGQSSTALTQKNRGVG